MYLDFDSNDETKNNMVQSPNILQELVLQFHWKWNPFEFQAILQICCINMYNKYFLTIDKQPAKNFTSTNSYRILADKIQYYNTTFLFPE